MKNSEPAGVLPLSIPDSQPQQVIARLASLEQEDDIGAKIPLLLPS